MKNSITKEEQLQLLGLKTLAIKHNNMLDDLRDSVMEIIGDDDPAGWASDFIFDNATTLVKMLNGAEIDTTV